MFVSGTFNVLHPGHLRLLKFAKANGDRLVVGVLTDRVAGSAAHVPQDFRLEAVKMNGLVDEAFLVDSAVEEVILKLKPALVVKGKEHKSHENPEQKAVDSYGGKLLFSSGDVVFSSLDLIRREMASQEQKSISLPKQFMSRRKVTAKSLIDVMQKFKGLKVVVVGDVIVDEYISCDPLGMSEEDPTIVVTPISSRTFIGGAAIVAAHAASLGAKVKFFSVVGDDASAKFCRDELSKFGVEHHLLVDDSRPTTLKQRFRSRSKTLLRVSHLAQRLIDGSLQNALVANVTKSCADADLLIFSDFNYGILPQTVVDQITAVAKKNKVRIVADSQSSSQIGDISRFKNMNLITPTEHEARISTKNYEAGLVILSEEIKKQSSAMNVLLKLGEEGLLINSDNGTFLTDKIGALNSSPKDVSGAGDSLLITSALALACGGTIWEAAFLGSLAASIQVGRVGNTPLTSKELQKNLN